MKDYFEWIADQADLDERMEMIERGKRFIEVDERNLEVIDGDAVAETERQD